MAIGTPNIGTYTERASETSTPVPYPATVNAGDMLYMLAALGATGATAVTVPAGWTQLDQHITATGVGPDIFVARTIAAGTEGGTTISVTHTNVASNWQIIGFSGVDTTTPEDVAVSSQATNSASLTQTIPGVTVATAGATLLYVAALNSTTGNATPSTGFTEAGDRISGTRAMETAYLQGASTGATGNVVVTWTVSAKSVGVLVAIRPASGSVLGDAAIAETATITAAGVVAASTGTAIAETAAITATGKVGKATGSSLAATATITAAGVVVAGSSGTATIAETATLTATGLRGTTSGAAIAPTAAIVAAGFVGTSSGAAIAATATITTAGTTGGTSGATVKWFDGTTEQTATLRGWWDGSAIQTATLNGWFDGTTTQALA